VQGQTGWREAGQGDDQKPAAQADQDLPQPSNSSLQAEIDRVGKVKFEQDPRKRPLVLSQRATTRVEWVKRALERGYLDSGHANVLWDAPARSAFEAFVDYTRGARQERFAPMIKRWLQPVWLDVMIR